jgi:hypothetical protein
MISRPEIFARVIVPTLANGSPWLELSSRNSVGRGHQLGEGQLAAGLELLDEVSLGARCIPTLDSPAWCRERRPTRFRLQED